MKEDKSTKVSQSVKTLGTEWLLNWCKGERGEGERLGRNLILCQGRSMYLPYPPKYWRGAKWWRWWSRLRMIRANFCIWPEWLGNIRRQRERERADKTKIVNYLRLTVQCRAQTKSRTSFSPLPCTVLWVVATGFKLDTNWPSSLSSLFTYSWHTSFLLSWSTCFPLTCSVQYVQRVL